MKTQDFHTIYRPLPNPEPGSNIYWAGRPDHEAHYADHGATHAWCGAVILSTDERRPPGIGPIDPGLCSQCRLAWWERFPDTRFLA